MEDLILSYHELNRTAVDELDNEPSPLEFMRYIGKNRPFVVRGGISHWPAIRQWTMKYLRDVMKDQLVKVAITPHGSVAKLVNYFDWKKIILTSNADSAVRERGDVSMYFVKPLEEDEPFCKFIEYVQKQELDGDLVTEVKYAQTRRQG